jgi:hypothetical protein
MNFSIADLPDWSERPFLEEARATHARNAFDFMGLPSFPPC